MADELGVVEGPDTDPFGGNNSDQGSYGPIGVVPPGPTPTPGSGPPGPQGPPGPPGPGGISNQAIFRFSHASGSISTGPLGFTPKLVLYSGVAQINGGVPGQITASYFNGFAFGTGPAQSGGGMTIMFDTSADVGVEVVSGTPSSIGGAVGFIGPSVGVSTAFIPSELDVTAFGPGGITLTWNNPVAIHRGSLLVIG